MKTRLCAVATCIALVPPILSCSTISAETRAARKFDVKITPEDPANPKRIRFDLYRTPYADVQDQRLPVHEQIRLGMRRFAIEQLAERGYCPHGFKGPDRVLVPERDIFHRFFFVDCLPPSKWGQTPFKYQDQRGQGELFLQCTSFKVNYPAPFVMNATGHTKFLWLRAGAMRMPWHKEHRKAVCGKTACTV